jgi:hypothetical protein
LLVGLERDDYVRGYHRWGWLFFVRLAFLIGTVQLYVNLSLSQDSSSTPQLATHIHIYSNLNWAYVCIWFVFSLSHLIQV